MPQQPVEPDQGVSALDAAGVEQRLDFAQRLDHHSDVLVLIGEAVHPAGQGGIDAAAKQATPSSELPEEDR